MGAAAFQRDATALKKKMWWKNMKLLLLIAVVIILILLAIIRKFSLFVLLISGRSLSFA